MTITLTDCEQRRAVRRALATVAGARIEGDRIVTTSHGDQP